MRPASSNQDLAIRPLGLGEIIDRAVAVTRRHFRPLFLWMLLLQGPAVAVSRVQFAGVSEVLANFSDATAALESLKELSRTSLWVVGALFLVQISATAICATVVAPSLSAGEVTGGPRTRQRLYAVATSALATLLVFIVVPAVAALPGLILLSRATSAAAWVGALALLLGGAAIGFVLTVLRTLLVPVVAAIEGRPHFAALRRSAALMGSSPGLRFQDRPAVRASLVLFASFAMAVAVNGLVAVPRAIAGRIAGVPSLLPAAMPPWAEIPLGLFEAVASAALQPFSLVAVVVLYFDRRARREGLDLARFAAEVEVDAEATR